MAQDMCHGYLNRQYEITGSVQEAYAFSVSLFFFLTVGVNKFLCLYNHIWQHVTHLC